MAIMPAINFVGCLKELLEKDKGGSGDIAYEMKEDIEEPEFQAVVVIPIGRLGLSQPLQCEGAVCRGKMAARQSAAEAALKELGVAIGSGSETASEASVREGSSADMVASTATSDGESDESDLQVQMPMVHRILLTGGPCGAKSTGIAMLKHVLPGQTNMLVQTIEDFGDMSGHGMDSPLDCHRMRCIQEERESVALEKATRTSQEHNKPVVLLIDRGVMERALEFAPPHAPLDVLDNYDVIVHMMSPAIDKPEFYHRIEKHGKPPAERACEEDLLVRRCYQKHKCFKVLWNGPDKGQAIPVWLGWKMKELLRVVQCTCCTNQSDHALEPRVQLNVVDEWLRSKQLREAFGCEQATGRQEVLEPLQKLLLKHLDGSEKSVTRFFDHVRFARPLDDKGFMDSLPESLRHYVQAQLPDILSNAASFACCAEKEQAAGKPVKVASELLRARSDAFKGQPPQVVNYVDIGSGTCTTASAVAKQLGLGKDQVTCLDVVESCGQRASDVTFMTFDGQTLPLPTASADLISVVHVLHHVEPGGSSMFHLLQEAKRVLKPGGVVIVKEHDSPNKHFDLYLEAMHSLKQLVFYTNEPEKMPLGSYQSLEEWRVTFRRVGLPVVHANPSNDIHRSVVMVLEKIADGE